MNKRIKLYISILAFVYALAFGQHFIEGLESGIEGFKEGWNMGQNTHVLREKGIKKSYLFFNVKPSSRTKNYPEEQLYNNHTIRLKSDSYQAEVISPADDVPLSYTILFALQLLITLPLIAILIYMPVLFIQISNLIKKGILLDNKVIRKISRMGWMIVSYYAINLFFNLGMTYSAKQMIELKDYNIVYDFSNTTLLILGLITLMLGEVLRTSLTMKEEQDLTI